MNRAASTRQATQGRARYACDTETVVVETKLTREVYTRFASIASPDQQRPVEQQAHMIFDCLEDVLAASRVSISDVVLDRAFFQDLDADLDLFRDARAEAYQKAGLALEDFPAPTYLHQPPARPGQAFELQTYAVVPNNPGDAAIRSVPTADPLTSGKIVEIGDHKHLYVTGINGCDAAGDIPADFREQSDNMFGKMPSLVEPHGAKFTDVLRTWCYLDDIDRDYDEFNLSRNAFFLQEGVQRMPASTGIRSGLQPQGALCATDLYALLTPESAGIELMHTPTLNEAAEYGSSFARGMKVELPEKTVLYISGTASVDELGATVHLDDVRKQIERMLLNIRELLAPHGSTFADTTQAITYLKQADYYDLFRQILGEWDILTVPNTIVEAGVCRPNLLCEMELIAMLPNKD